MKKSMLFRFLVLISSLLFCFPIAACNRSEADAAGEDVIRLGVCISNFDDTWNQYLKTAMEEYCNELGVEATFLDGKEDTSRQIEQVESFVIDGVDAIIVTPVNTAAVKTISETVLAADIDLVYVNRYPEELPEEAFYVGSKERDAGVIQGQFLEGYLQLGDQVAILMGKLNEEASPKRTEGVVEAIENLGGVVVDQQAGNWLRPEGMRITEDWITKYGSQLKAICANNDDTTVRYHWNWKMYL